MIINDKDINRKDIFPIVGIGASAGGLEALERFFGNTPSQCNMAFVVIVHLAPRHKSLMDTILKKWTAMKVFQIQDGMAIEPNCIYVNPPARNVSLSGNVFKIMTIDETVGMNMPINRFFQSLAQEQQEKAIGIILSGTGSDGTIGIEAVKSFGGMAMVQKESEARFDGMPKSAIHTGLVDFVLPVEKMPEKLVSYVNHPYIHYREKDSLDDSVSKSNFMDILALIRTKTGNDFSNYKQKTVNRRIERRMALHQVDRLEDYLSYCRQAPEEVENLFKDMLIGVTGFFRDAKVFDTVKLLVLPELVNRISPDNPLRFWVTGCSTGEEAFSLAILLAEVMQEKDKHGNVQIFATDVDREAIDYARTALYPDSIAADISSERLQRFFIYENGSYRVTKEIREMVIFSLHSIIKDPPFSRIDLISCRNVLIYMNQNLQRKVLPLFHYALNSQGCLLLGTSESIGDFNDLFSAIDIKQRLYRRRDTFPALGRRPLLLPFQRYHCLPGHADAVMARTANRMRDIALGIAVDTYTCPCVLINEKSDVLFFVGKTAPYLVQPTGEPSFNLLKMAREEIRYVLSMNISKAAKSKSTVLCEGLQITHNKDTVVFNLIIRPLTELKNPPGLIMVIFEDRVSLQKQAVRKTEHSGNVKDLSGNGEEYSGVDMLQHELDSTRENLQATIEELECTNEELRASNEEMEAINEELQSANEELEGSREELNSANEELETVNDELRDKVIELSDARDDLNNLLCATEIATLFLDRNLFIKRFTPRLSDIFNLRISDTGRPIGDITSNLLYGDLLVDAKKVLDTLQTKKIELMSKDNAWYSVHIMPYRTIENVIDGLVITFVEITALKSALFYAESIFETAQKPLVVLDSELKIVMVNDFFCRVFKVKREDTIGRFIYEIRENRWNIPDFRKLLDDVVDRNIERKDFKAEYGSPETGLKKIVVNSRLFDKSGATSLFIVLTMEEIPD